MVFPSIPTIDCTGTPREMGRQYGEAVRDAICTNVAIWHGRTGLLPGHRTFAAITRTLLERKAPDVLEELEGLAEGSGIDLASLIVESTIGTPMTQQCTSMAIRTGPDGCVLGKNNDGASVEERLWVIRRTHPAHGLPLVQIVSAGWLSGFDGMNAAGLANGHNSVGSILPRHPDTLEIRLWTYHLMQRCSTTRAFVAGLTREPLNGKGFNMVVADVTGDTCVLECAVPKVVCRSRGEPFVYATNHYISDALKDADGRTPDGKRISTYRLGYLDWRDRMDRPSTEQDIRAILKSHEPWAPCRHGGAHVSQTLWSIVAVPARHRMDIAPGPPCQCEYGRFDV